MNEKNQNTTRFRDFENYLNYSTRGTNIISIGDDGMTEYGWRTNKTARNKTVTERERKLSDALKHRWRIYFPTRDTVAASKGGIGVS